MTWQLRHDNQKCQHFQGGEEDIHAEHKGNRQWNTWIITVCEGEESTAQTTLQKKLVARVPCQKGNIVAVSH